MCWDTDHDPGLTLFGLLLVIKSEFNMCVEILIISERTAVINAHLTSINYDNA